MTTKAVHESEASLHPVAKGQVLIVATNCSQFEDGSPTGLWLSELAEPYYHFKQSGYDVTIASPAGGAVPVDAASLDGEAATEPARRFLEDAEASQQLTSSVLLADVAKAPTFYDCIFLPGGHGPMMDLAHDATLANLITAAFAAGKVVAAVCHGPAGLIGAKDSMAGRPLVAGRTVTAFTAEEEAAVKKDAKVPFMLGQRLSEEGATVTKGPSWQPHVEVDGRLITGQNPASAVGVAEAAVRAMAAPAPAGGGAQATAEAAAA